LQLGKDLAIADALAPPVEQHEPRNTTTADG
jgi:hypothetical protein